MSHKQPFRADSLEQHMWAELSRGDQLEYLGAEGQARVKGALTVLAAYGALREHPLQAGVNSPQQVRVFCSFLALTIASHPLKNSVLFVLLLVFCSIMAVDSNAVPLLLLLLLLQLWWWR